MKRTYVLLILAALGAGVFVNAAAAPGKGARSAQSSRIRGVTAIGAGWSHACALSDGRMFCWGRNRGELGDGTVTPSTTPVRVRGLGSNVKHLAVSEEVSCGSTPRALKCWGAVRGWFSPPRPDSVLPRPLGGTGHPVDAVALTYDIPYIAVPGACAITRGSVYCGAAAPLRKLKKVKGLSGKATAVAAGSSTCAIVDGGAKCWGKNKNGTLGNGTFHGSAAPVDVVGLQSGVTAIARGVFHFCAVASGAVKCWGTAEHGDLGPLGSGYAATPVDVPGAATGATAVAAGDTHSCAVVRGAAKCWGNNDRGQLGDGTKKSSSSPRDVVGLSSGVTAISAGQDFTCAVVRGAAKCWGANTYGQLGDGSRKGSSVPVSVAAPRAAVRNPGRHRVHATVDATYGGGGAQADIEFKIPAHVQANQACAGVLTTTYTGKDFKRKSDRSRMFVADRLCMSHAVVSVPDYSDYPELVRTRFGGNSIIRAFSKKSKLYYNACADSDCP